MDIEVLDPIVASPVDALPIDAALAVAAQNDPIATLVAIQSRGDRAETLAIKELVSSVVGVPEDNIVEMVKEYKKQASQAGWAASTLKVRASNLKGVLECARVNSAFADLVALQSACGLQRAYAMRAEFLKAINAAQNGSNVPSGSDDADEGSDGDEGITAGLTSTGAYIQALARAIVCAEVSGHTADIAVLRNLMEKASMQP